MAQRLKSRQDFPGFVGAIPGVGGSEEISSGGTTPGVVVGAEFEAAGLRGAMFGVGA